MNKGLILEIKEKEVIVLTKDGSFLSVKKASAHDLDIGEEIVLPRSVGMFQQFISKKWVLPALAAACFMLIISAIIGNPFIVKEGSILAYVHVDINPSIELGVNKQLEVINLEALNQDGQDLLLALDFRPRQKLDEVTIHLLAAAAEQGYFKDNHDVLIATSFTAEQENEELVQAIDLALDQVDYYLHHGEQQMAQTKLGEQSAIQEVSLEPVADQKVKIASGSLDTHDIALHRLKTDPQVRVEAKEKGISPGKYTIYLQAKEQGVITELEDVKGKSISELAKELGGLGEIRSSKEKPKHNNKPREEKSGKQHEQKNQQGNGDKSKEKNVKENRNKDEQKNNKAGQNKLEENKNRGKQEHKGENKKSPPGLEKKEAPPKAKAKKDNDANPPGQAKKEGTPGVKEPPGQAKKQKEGHDSSGQHKEKLKEEKKPHGRNKEKQEKDSPKNP